MTTRSFQSALSGAMFDSVVTVSGANPAARQLLARLRDQLDPELLHASLIGDRREPGLALTQPTSRQLGERACLEILSSVPRWETVHPAHVGRRCLRLHDGQLHVGARKRRSDVLRSVDFLTSHEHGGVGLATWAWYRDGQRTDSSTIREINQLAMLLAARTFSRPLRLRDTNNEYARAASAAFLGVVVLDGDALHNTRRSLTEEVVEAGNSVLVTTTDQFAALLAAADGDEVALRRSIAEANLNNLADLRRPLVLGGAA